MTTLTEANNVSDVAVTVERPPIRWPSWACALSPLANLGMFLVTAWRVRIQHGGWPMEWVDHFEGSAALAETGFVLTLGFSMFAAFPLMVLFMAWRRFRLSGNTQLCQVGVFFGGHLLALITLGVLPVSWVSWFLD